MNTNCSSNHNHPLLQINRLIWRGPEAQKGAEAPKQAESINDIYQQLIQAKGKLEGKRADLGWKMGAKLMDHPFDPRQLREMFNSKRLMEDINIRNGIAGNVNTPRDILIKLAKDKDIIVRAIVAGRKEIPKKLRVKLLKEMAVSDEWYARGEAAKNPDTPKELLDKLAGDEDVGTAMEVIENPSATDAMVIKVAKRILGEPVYKEVSPGYVKIVNRVLKARGLSI